MSQQIPTAYVQSYGGNVIALYQQADSKLQGAVREEPMKAKAHYFDRIEPTAAVLKTVRHGATPIVDTPHSRRMVVMADYEWADLIDPQDELRILIDPKSQYAINAVKALVNGEIDTILGFKFHRSTRLPIVTGTDKKCFAWQADAMGVAVGMPIKTNVSVRDDLSYATQVYAAMTLGAVRLQGAGVARYRFNDNI